MRRMAKVIRVLFIGAGMCALFVTAWWLWRHYIPQISPTLSPPITFSQKLPVLDTEGLARLEEITSFTAAATSGPVVALVLPARQDELLAAYSGDDYVRKWNLSNHTLAAEAAIDVVIEKRASFDSNGIRFANASCVWNTTTGALIWSETDCVNAKNELILYPRDSWVLGYSRGTRFLGVWCSEIYCNGLATYGLSDVDDPEGPLTIDTVTLDSTGSFAAVAFEQGNIRIYAFTGEANLDLFYKVELGGRGRRGAPTQALVFDDTRSWLASLQRDQLSVWDLRLGRNRLYFSASVPAGKVLTFDQTGKFLLVGTDSALYVWEVASKKLLKEYAAEGISALTTSPDGRLVIWGDARGVVHVWGAATIP